MSKRLVFTIMLVSLMVIASIPVMPVMAQSADGTTWTSAITYYTPSTTGGTLNVSFYAEGSSTPINADPITLAPNKAGSLNLGVVSVPGMGTTFKGAAVMSSDVPVYATNVEIAASPNQSQYSRAFSNGFLPTDGASTFYVPTVLRETFNTNSQVGVQNIEGFDATATLKFYAVGVAAPVLTVDRDISSNSSIIFKVGDFTGAPATFNGSLVITAIKKGDPATPAKVVASAVERDVTGRRTKAFEGVADGATKIYMASMLCNYVPGAGQAAQTTNYAIQALADAAVTVKFYDTAGNLLVTSPVQNISAGGKASLNPCTLGVANNKSGSAVIESSTGKVIAVGKVGASDGTTTAFNGAPAGALRVVAPYIRWAAVATQDYRSNIAIMNVGTGNATNIVVKYYDGNGNLAASHTVASAASPLGQFIKTNSSPSAAGALTGGGFGLNPAGGAIEVQSDQPIVVVVRGARIVSFGTTTKFAEDYNGQVIP